MVNYKIFFLNRSFTICESDFDVSEDSNELVYHNAPSVAEALGDNLCRQGLCPR